MYNTFLKNIELFTQMVHCLGDQGAGEEAKEAEEADKETLKEASKGEYGENASKDALFLHNFCRFAYIFNSGRYKWRNIPHTGEKASLD